MNTKSATALATILLILLPLGVHAAAAAPFGAPIFPEECRCEAQPNPQAGGAPITTAPDYGCVLQVIQNVINSVVLLAAMLAVIVITIAGAKLVTSPNNPAARSEAKARLLNIAIGLAVFLSAWLFVDFIMKTLYNQEGEFGPWNAILAPSADGDRCIVAKNPTPITEGTVGIVTGVTPGTSSEGTGGGTPSTGAGGGSCTTIPDSQLVDIGNGHRLVSSAATRFKSMQTAAAAQGVTITPVSGYRSPERQTEIWKQNCCSIVSGKTVCTCGLVAAVPCSMGGSGSNHSRGTAIDVSRNAIPWIKANGSKYGFINSIPYDPVHFSDTGR